MYLTQSSLQHDAAIFCRNVRVVMGEVVVETRRDALLLYAVDIRRDHKLLMMASSQKASKPRPRRADCWRQMTGERMAAMWRQRACPARRLSTFRIKSTSKVALVAVMQGSKQPGLCNLCQKVAMLGPYREIRTALKNAKPQRA